MCEFKSAPGNTKTGSIKNSLVMTSIQVSIPGYRINEQLYNGSRTLVYRAIRETDSIPVVIKLLKNPYPSFTELVQFRNQYTIAKNLNLPGIIETYSLEVYQNGYALVMEFGGISLKDYFVSVETQVIASVQEFLEVAIALCDTLDILIRSRIIHKDIKPANILINPETKQVKLIDFSIASLLPRETQILMSPNVLEGTLGYLSPEQTGRMNRGIDYRTDFYSLGVTFYELLTGKLPFESNDAMELVHCHIAKLPPSLEGKRQEIPKVISNIVMKLMAKNAEDRYQSASGLKYDLETCLHQLKETGKIDDFKIAQRDLCDRFIIPEKLYGRENEVAELLAAFDRVAGTPRTPRSQVPPGNAFCGLLPRDLLEAPLELRSQAEPRNEEPRNEGQRELMLVAGFSGIGKTAIVNEVHKPIVRQRGYFIKGKFDQFNRNIPFSAFVQAFRDLMAQLNCESDAELSTWKNKILQALGDNGQVIIEVIPELKQIIGQQPPTAKLSGTAAQNRFNLLFQNFIQVFTTKEHPLVIFLDDLQWADSASLKLMQLLMSESSREYLLLIGAYRDNEVSAGHPLMLTLEEISKANAIINTITLTPLNLSSLNQLVADTLSCSAKIAQPLTQLVYQKTKGNPFFSTQFIKALHEDGLIKFDLDARNWQCDIAAVKANSCDDVVEFMALQLQKLPQATQNVLKLAACIGNQFDLVTLAIVSEKSETETAADLWKALQEQLILPQSEVYKFFQDDGDGKESTQLAISNYPLANYKFLHDRVQQAAYSLILEAQKKTTHLKIGQLLLKNTSREKLERNIFDIVNQLNVGIETLTEPSEKTELARLNLMAGRKAKAAAAYEPTFKYSLFGLGLLGDSWHEYDLALTLHELAAEAAYLTGNFEQMEKWAEIVLQQTKTILDKVKVYEIKMQGLMAQAKVIQAIKLGLQVLKLLDINLPNSPTFPDIQQALGETATYLHQKNIPDLINLPLMTDAHKLAAMRILASMIAPAATTMPPLLPLTVLSQVKLSIQYGNAPFSPFAYAMYGQILQGIVLDIEASYQFGNLALGLVEQLNANEVRAKSLFIVALSTKHIKEHLRETLPLFQQAYTSGLENGDLEFAAWATMYQCKYAYFAGREIASLERIIATTSDTLTQFKQAVILNYHEILRQVVLNLLGKADDPCCLVGEAYNEETNLPHLLAVNDRPGLHFLYVHKLILCYLLEESNQALAYAECALTYLDAVPGMLYDPIFHFYDSLARLAIYLDSQRTQQQEILAKVQANQEKMQLWAHHAPMNFQHKFDLVEAEKHRIFGQKTETMEYYDKAITLARINGYIQEEALSNELAAKFYLDWGKEKVAQAYMQEAYYCYARWGAKAKVDDLEKRYPQLLAFILQPKQNRFQLSETRFPTANKSSFLHQTIQTTRSSSSISDSLDFASILKASLALSSEIQLEQLISTLMQVVMENAGAKKAALLLIKNATLIVEAVATINDGVTVLSVPLSISEAIPLRLVNYVKRTLKTVVLDDATAQNDFIADSYLMQQQPKSVLCTPVLNQGKLIGLLYLENELTIGAFTGDRVEVIQLLCTQAAISLENAYLYQQSQDYAQQLKHSLDFLQQKARMTAFRADVDRIITQDYSLQEMLQHCTEAVVQHLDAAFARIWTLNCEEQILELQASAGMYTHIDGAHGRIFVGQFKIGWIAQERQPHLTNQVIGDRRIANQEWARREGIMAFAGFPLIVDGQLVGVLAMFARQILSESILESLKFAASEIALGIKRKQSEKALLQSKTQLRQKSEELEQTIEQLKQAQLQTVQNEKMATLGNLVAGVAHEINNPIGFLKGSVNNVEEYIQDLLDHIQSYQQHHRNPAPEVTEHAEEIDLEYLSEDLPKLINSMRVATERIKDISISLRTFSRADTAEKVACNLYEGIESTLLILKYRLKANEKRPAIEVITNYGNLPPVKCFLGQLNQVFMNILANAIDALDTLSVGRTFAEIQANPLRIRISTEVSSDQNTIAIRIIDNALGMPSEIQAHIFDHLFTTKEVGKGTGLGLAIARQIVEQTHNGKLSCNSVLGQGTEFVIEIPFA
jgi:predicted ATPase/signal transduction histidine kinase